MNTPQLDYGSPVTITASYGRDTAHVAASRTSRETQGWDPGTGSPDADLNSEVEMITGRARDLDRNSGLAQNLKNTKADNIIGVGLQWQPKPNWEVLGQSSDWAHEWARTAKAVWKDYATSRYFDADGRNNFALHSRLIHDSRFTNGSAIAIPMWKERPGTAYRTCFKIIEADRLSNPRNEPDSEKVAGGVQRKKDGEVEGYWIRNTHPGSDTSNGNEEWEFIEAFFPNGRRRFLHVYHQDRPGQVRGKSAVAAVMAAFGLRGKYQLTELQAAEISSRVAGVMETPLSDEAAQALFGGDSSDYQKLRREWKGKLTAGMILKLPPGSQYKTHIPNRPATAYVGFMDHISREIGIAVGLPDQLSLRDFTKVNYSSARAALLEAWRGFYVERAEISFQWGTPCVELVLEEAIELGLIEAPDFQTFRNAYTTGKWLGKGHQPIDRLKHENANKIALEIGTTTMQDIYSEDGEDWEEQAEQSMREKARAMENKYRLAQLEKELREKYKVEPEPDPPKPPDDPDAPKSDEEIDEEDAKNDPDAGEPAGADDQAAA